MCEPSTIGSHTTGRQPASSENRALETCGVGEICRFWCLMTDIMRSVLMNRLTSSRRWGLSIALLAMPVWAAAQPVGVTTQPPVIPTQPPRDRLPPTQRVGTAVLKGRVVDGASSAPVPRARVRLLGPAGSRPPVLTDAEGAFELSALPSGTYSLQVEKSTYMTGRYPDAARSIRAKSTPLILRDGQVVENFTIPLFHGGAISAACSTRMAMPSTWPRSGRCGYHAADVRRWRDRCSRTISESFGFRGCSRGVHHPGPQKIRRASFRRTRRSPNYRWPSHSRPTIPARWRCRRQRRLRSTVARRSQEST